MNVIDNDLVQFCLRHMISKVHIHKLYQEYDIKYKKIDSYEKLVSRLNESYNVKIDEKILKDYHRGVWKPAPIKLHLENLKNGSLKGHNWHGAMPYLIFIINISNNTSQLK